MKRKTLTRNVWILSLVSFTADIASEMLYPIMPVYLRTIGFSVLLIGLLEGLAEAIAGLSKGYFGKLSDSKGVRLPFIRWGYLLSAVSKPMMGLFSVPLWIFGARTLDRLGKGLRTGARDALLSEEASPETKARVFGFHRGMDTLGAVFGPFIALLYLDAHPSQYTTLFYAAFIPGIIAVLLIYLIRERKKVPVKNNDDRNGFHVFAFTKYWKKSPSAYRKLVTGLLLFALFNSSDYFLLLKLKEADLADNHIIAIYMFYNLVYAAFSYPMGILADKFGLKNIFVAGLILFALVYAGMAFTRELYLFIILFFLYGIYAAATEGISKAWITNICRQEETATAIGTYTAFQSICILLASSLAGLIWSWHGSATVFLISAVVSLAVGVYLAVVMRSRHADV
ncbi:MAG: MFS transporter [Chitinophagaceae bacterium]